MPLPYGRQRVLRRVLFRKVDIRQMARSSSAFLRRVKLMAEPTSIKAKSPQNAPDLLIDIIAVFLGRKRGFDCLLDRNKTFLATTACLWRSRQINERLFSPAACLWCQRGVRPMDTSCPSTSPRWA